MASRGGAAWARCGPRTWPAPDAVFSVPLAVAGERRHEWLPSSRRRAPQPGAHAGWTEHLLPILKSTLERARRDSRGHFQPSPRPPLPPFTDEETEANNFYKRYNCNLWSASQGGRPGVCTKGGICCTELKWFRSAHPRPPFTSREIIFPPRSAHRAGKSPPFGTLTGCHPL